MQREKEPMKISILVAAHKPYPMPGEAIYLPVQVGAKGKDSIDPAWARDDAGENISEKNPTFCELTGLYWAWKNLDADAVGLCHYRRYPGRPGIRRLGGKGGRLLTGAEAEALLSKADLILPKKRHYWIETRGSQYAHAHHAEDLRCVEGILSERCPEYLPAWKHMLSTRSGHICNMFVMPRRLFDPYCEWLFGILFEAERRLDIDGYSAQDRRVFGFLGERLLDVWVERKALAFTEVPVVNTEKQHWLRKGSAFLKRKLVRRGTP